MRRLPQSVSYVVTLKLYLSSDHLTPATGKTVAITISKNGGAFGNPNAGATNATEISNGWYKVTLDTTDTGTLGDLIVRGTATDCDDSEQQCQVCNPHNGGWDALPNAAAEAAGGLYTRGTGAGQINQPANGLIDINVERWNATAVPAEHTAGYPVVTIKDGTGTGEIDTTSGGVLVSTLSTTAKADVNTEVDTALSDVGLTTTITGRIDVAVSSRLATAGYTAPDNASITSILADTNELQTDWTNGGRLDLLVDGIKAKTDNLPSDPADQSLIIAATDSLATLINAVPTAAENVAALAAHEFETGWSLEDHWKISSAALYGKSSGLATSTAVYRDVNDSIDRISATVDEPGNRSAVTLNVS